MNDSGPKFGPKACGCALLLILIGFAGIFMPLFGIQFKLVSALAESLGIPSSLGGVVVIGIALVLGIGGVIISRVETSTSTPKISQPSTIASIYLEWDDQGRIETRIESELGFNPEQSNKLIILSVPALIDQAFATFRSEVVLLLLVSIVETFQENDALPRPIKSVLKSARIDWKGYEHTPQFITFHPKSSITSGEPVENEVKTMIVNLIIHLMNQADEQHKLWIKYLALEILNHHFFVLDQVRSGEIKLENLREVFFRRTTQLVSTWPPAYGQDPVAVDNMLKIASQRAHMVYEELFSVISKNYRPSS